MINLARSKERYQRVSAQLDQAHVAHQRIDAIDGERLSDREYSALYHADHPNAYYKTLSKGEVACYLSHRQAWQAIIDNDLDFAIILEDDVALQNNFNQCIQTIAQMPADWDYLKLAEFPVKRRPIHSHVMGDFERIIYNKVPARTCAQAVSRIGALKLLQHSESLFRPIDIDLQFWWEKDIDVFGLLPYSVQPIVDIQSDIDHVNTRQTAQKHMWQKLTNMWHFFWQNREQTRRKVAQHKQHH